MAAGDALADRDRALLMKGAVVAEAGKEEFSDLLSTSFPRGA